MFYDRVRIHVKAGDGGHGAISFRREKYVPRGGPDGGDGGRGGSVFITADSGLNTLQEFRNRRRLRAGSGEGGSGNNRHGKKGEDLHLKVPVGTMVWAVEEGQEDPVAGGVLIADLLHPGDTALVAKGGRGGLGNSHFATSTQQTPRVAQKGEPGAERWLFLDLRLIADVGLIGVPNAGKSSLLARISAAQPKIAGYPFTTLEPNLGVVDVGYRSFVAADIPGLIEGAHRGLGLGHEFLRHIQRTRVLVHLVDGSSPDPVGDYHAINRELTLFEPALASKPQQVAINKIDLPFVRERLADLQRAFALEGVTVHAISAATGEGVAQLLAAVVHTLDEAPVEAPVAPVAEVEVLRPHAINRFTVEKEDGAFVVRGALVERAAVMTDVTNRDALRLLEMQLRKMGVLDALEKAGVAEGSPVRIGKVELVWSAERHGILPAGWKPPAPRRRLTRAERTAARKDSAE
ncbi:MAG: GTPase ObgE [Chloroflexota bacterium]|nr:MAG: GTPase ObgE [Chloroflexota bacterium]